MTVDEWVARHPEAEPVVALVRGTASFDEAVKWGRPTFTVNGDWHHWVCAVAAGRSGTAVVFHKGALLADPTGVLSGGGQYIRQVGAERALAAPDEVAALVQDALAHQTDL